MSPQPGLPRQARLPDAFQRGDIHHRPKVTSPTCAFRLLSLASAEAEPAVRFSLSRVCPRPFPPTMAQADTRPDPNETVLAAGADVVNEDTPLLPENSADKPPAPASTKSSWRTQLAEFLDSPRVRLAVMILVVVSMVSVTIELMLSMLYQEEEQDAIDHPAFIVMEFISDAAMWLLLGEFCARVVACGPQYYFTDFLIFFDGFVTVVSFTLAVVLRGILGDAAVLLIALRVWRIVDFTQAVIDAVQSQFDSTIETLEEENKELKAQISDVEKQLEIATNNPDMDFEAIIEAHISAKQASVVIHVEEQDVSLGFWSVQRSRLIDFFESKQSQQIIISLIVFDILVVILELFISLLTEADTDPKHVFHPLFVWLEWASIGILGLFVVEVYLKYVAYGVSRYYDDWLEAFDAFIIVTSFFLQLVLRGSGIADDIVALIIILRIWRVIRIFARLGDTVEENFQQYIKELEKEKVELTLRLEALKETMDNTRQTRSIRSIK
ncbi:uncharacterized protein BJ171DRAFT_493814 [Polychytrium aggregatum]|uniref:uncharacterized protein n=1 Tax=Polychytrium aggregatum TaxID=110093 RepID=UPI0022FE9496|nr:uncharacterized protein BJ171DRAFT_493814 [Polychytrium aggregatum]KAI9207175.1 hypothetical protein BJ171DRAFT_493814 [Polychytrium aggregatum]